MPSPSFRQQTLWDESAHPRESTTHGDRRPGEFAPKGTGGGPPSGHQAHRLTPPAPPRPHPAQQASAPVPVAPSPASVPQAPAAVPQQAPVPTPAAQTAPMDESRVVSENMGLVGKVLREFPAINQNNREDMMQIGSVALVEAWRRFDPSRGNQFSTLAVPTIRNAVLNELKKEQRRGRAGGLSSDPDSPESDPWQNQEDESAATPEDITGKDELISVLGKLVDNFPAEDSEMLMRYYSGESQGSIAQSLGVDRLIVNRNISGMMDFLKRKMMEAAPEGYSRYLDWDMLLERYARKVHPKQRNFFDQHTEEELHRKPFREELHPRESSDYGTKHKGQFAEKHGTHAEVKTVEHGPGKWTAHVMMPKSLEEIVHHGESHNDVMNKAHSHGNDNGYLVRHIAEEPEIAGLFGKESEGSAERDPLPEGEKKNIQGGSLPMTGHSAMDWMIGRASPMKSFPDSLREQPTDMENTGIFEGRLPSHMINSLREYAKSKQTRSKDSPGTSGGILYNITDDNGKRFSVDLNSRSGAARLTWDHNEGPEEGPAGKQTEPSSKPASEPVPRNPDEESIRKMAPGATERLRKERQDSQSGYERLVNNNRWNENHIKISADDISQLRKPDVYRVLSSAPFEKQGQLESWIIKRRPELAEEVNRVSGELIEEHAKSQGWSDQDEPGQEPEFSLKPPEPPRKKQTFEGAMPASQGSMFDAGREDLPGQSMLFNTDPGADPSDPTTMENQMKNKAREMFSRVRSSDILPFENELDRYFRECTLVDVDRYGIGRSIGSGMMRVLLASILASIVHSMGKPGGPGWPAGQQAAAAEQQPEERRMTDDELLAQEGIKRPDASPRPKNPYPNAAAWISEGIGKKDAPESREERDSNGQADWITIGGHTDSEGHKHAGGTAIQIDDEGEIKKGPDHLEGRDLDDLDSSAEGAEGSEDHRMPGTVQAGSFPDGQNLLPGREETAGSVTEPPQPEMAEGDVGQEQQTEDEGVEDPGDYDDDPFGPPPDRPVGFDAVEKANEKNLLQAEFKKLNHHLRKKITEFAESRDLDPIDLFRQAKVEFPDMLKYASEREVIKRDVSRMLGVNAKTMREIQEGKSWRGEDPNDFKVRGKHGMDTVLSELTRNYPGHIDAYNPTGSVADILSERKQKKLTIHSDSVLDRAAKHLRVIRDQDMLDSVDPDAGYAIDTKVEGVPFSRRSGSVRPEIHISEAHQHVS